METELNLMLAIPLLAIWIVLASVCFWAARKLPEYKCGFKGAGIFFLAEAVLDVIIITSYFIIQS